MVNNDALQPPVARLGSKVELSFDDFTHSYTRYIYKVELCNADWTPATEVFESDWLVGFNEQPIEDYETSFNTTLLYTHYRVSFPNANTRLKMSGNYRVTVYADESDRDDEPVLEACFMLLSPEMSISASILTNTDIDVNQSHQQIQYSLSFGQRKVIDVSRELHTVVLQNRRWDNAVIDLMPNIQRNGAAEWTHRRELIFPAGNEYHKFEILDPHIGGMGVEQIDWFDPFYHATLYPITPSHNYSFDEDTDGAYIIRRSYDEDNDTQSEYLFVHFQLKSTRLPGGDVYVTGQWDNGFPDPACRLSYDEAAGIYEGSLLLKQGYYNYQFVQADSEGRGVTNHTEGNFYQTENEYIILVYHRPIGSRHDALVGYATIKSK
ncbi:MAG: DUF5103 domain-containing protein [Bacteroidaceae bacterium]|nr:DUF5103 domain-containing protein [Bacteroidaceae bacterium]